MVKHGVAIVFLLSLIYPAALLAQDSIRKDASRPNFIGFPIIFSTPETSWGFGAAASLTYRWKGQSMEDRPSQVTLITIYTLEKQLLLFTPFDIYTYDNRYNFLGEIGYYRYIYPFFGLGNETGDEEEYYGANYPRLRLFASKKWSNNIYSGVYVGFDHFELEDIDAGGLLENSRPLGIQGGTTREIGWHLAYDSRDQIFYPGKGIYARLVTAFAWDALGSDYDYRIFRLDMRSYATIASDLILANRLWWEGKPGNPPFYLLPELGGRQSMRGVVKGRYRDKYLLLGQAEFRYKVYKRWGLVAFGSLGKVENEFFTDFEGLHWAAGLGIRFELDTENHIHLRGDYAISRDMKGFYFVVTEAF